MTEMTLQEVQRVSLDILTDVHEFCESHNIKYSLAYGTLIGAIRHKGFIPWDDDIDIVIPRPDFDRFCRDFQSAQGYKLYVPEAENNYLTFARVCDNERTQTRTNSPWSPEQTGVWIDVFPLDGLPDDEVHFFDLVKNIRKIEKIEMRLRTGKLLKFKDIMDVKHFVYCMIKRILYFRYDLFPLIHQHVELLRKNHFDDMSYCGQLCCMDYPEKEHNPKTDFDHYILMPFCDTHFYVMNGYDNILRRYYGDYMQLPPKHKQVPPQQSYIKFYWKA